MITIDYKSRQPIYEQLVDRVRALALSGALTPGEKLPSVRQLSADLGVNPNTVQRAYNTLLQQGVIMTAPGKGNYVSDDTETLRLQKRREVLGGLYGAATAAKSAGVPDTQAMEWVRKAYDEEEPNA